MKKDVKDIIPPKPREEEERRDIETTI